MKKTISILLAILVMACGQELEIDPTSSVDSSKAKQNVELMVIGAYGLIGSGGVASQTGALYSTDLILNADLLASENYIAWDGTFSQYNEIAYKAMSSTNSSVGRMWSKAYSAINLANTILANLSGVPQADRDRFKGHALFIRGIVQFELLRFWKDPEQNLGIPLQTQATETYEQVMQPARASITESYNAVIADLTEAKSLLPENDGVFGNQYTAAAFLARVYLDRGDYANARTQANEVIADGNYALANSVEQAFNISGSPESIFEIQQTTINNAGTANDGLTTFYACDPNTPGSASRGDIDIDPAFIDLYEATDKRRALLIYEGTCNRGNITSAKWKNPYTNIPVVRLSEMYLIRAEANIRLGTAIGDSPVNDVNAIRQKADATPYAIVTLDDILLERELELAFEGQRIHDFKRIGKTTVAFDEEGEPYDVDYSGPEFVLPIPQVEINTNKNLKQNSYYQ